MVTCCMGTYSFFPFALLKPREVGILFLYANTMLAVVLTEILDMLIGKLQEWHNRVVVQSVVTVFTTYLDMHALAA